MVLESPQLSAPGLFAAELIKFSSTLEEPDDLGFSARAILAFTFPFLRWKIASFI